MTARLSEGRVHGDDATGLVDISFPNSIYAAPFVGLWQPYTTVRLREPVATLEDPRRDPGPVRTSPLRTPPATASNRQQP
jgi:hypothetical protein